MLRPARAKCHVDSSCYSVILRRERTSKTRFLLFLIFVWTTFNFQLHEVLMPNNSTRPTPLKLSLMATRFTQVQRKVSRLVHVDIRYTLRRCPLDRFELRSFTHVNQAICINKLHYFIGFQYTNRYGYCFLENIFRYRVIEVFSFLFIVPIHCTYSSLYG